jgi:hypothetical protein
MHSNAVAGGAYVGHRGVGPFGAESSEPSQRRPLEALGPGFADRHAHRERVS